MANDHKDVRGIEHIGITVSDIDQAAKYFVETLGGKPICEVLYEPVSGPDLERALGVPKGASIERSVHLRIGEGPNIELFKYTADEQREGVRPCDFGLQHFAVYVDDIDAVAERVRKAGGEVLGEVDALPDFESGPGNRFVYTRLPWGGTMELITIPSAQVYEAKTPMRKWKPARRGDVAGSSRLHTQSKY